MIVDNFICLNCQKPHIFKIDPFIMHPVKKILSLVVALMLLIVFQASAQNIETGVKAYESGDYKAAMAELDKVLADPAKLKEKLLARAYYYRALARLTYVRKAHGNLEVTQMPQIRTLTIGAHQDLLAAKKNDIDGKMATDLLSGNKRMLELLLELGRAANAIAQDPNKKEADKKEAYQDMVLYGDPIVAIDKFHYMGYIFLANGQVGLRDSVKALKNYHLADDWFFKSAPKDGDLDIAYTYIQIGRMEWALNKNYDVAMKALEEGRKNLDAEHRKIETLGGHTPTEKAALSHKFHDVGLDLDRAFSDLRLAAGK
jgi:tetratricopeptide (TPR) repeat protein